MLNKGVINMVNNFSAFRCFILKVAFLHFKLFGRGTFTQEKLVPLAFSLSFFYSGLNVLFIYYSHNSWLQLPLVELKLNTLKSDIYSIGLRKYCIG